MHVYNSTEPYWCQIGIDLDSGLATNRRQIIDYTNADTAPRNLYEPLYNIS